MRAARNFFAVLFSLLALAAAAGTLYLCARAERAETQVEDSGPDGPTAALEAFFACLERKDFTGAYGYLSNYSSLGLETPPSDRVAARFWAVRQDAWRFTVYDGYEMEGTQLIKRAAVMCLDERAAMQRVGALVQEKLAAAVQAARLRSEVYDENGDYREELVRSALEAAVDETLSNVSPYLYSRELSIRLDFEDGRWRIDADAELISALSDT